MRFKQQYVIPLIVAITAAPFVAAWLLLNFTGSGRGGAASHGTLIEPPRPLPDFVLLDAFSKSSAAHLHGKWSLLYLSSDECGTDCLDQLRKMRQMRFAMGENAHRVQRVLVLYGAHPPLASLRLPEAHAGQLLLDGTEIDTHDPGAAFRLAEGDEPVQARRIYLIDPLGNLMMSYAPDVDARGIVADLKRLLRYSHIG